MSVEKSLGYFFFDKTILQRALIRPSYAADRAQDGQPLDQQAYVLLGQHLLCMVWTELMVRAGHTSPEAIAPRLAQLSQEEALARVSLALNVDFFVKLGTAEQHHKAYGQPAVMADTLKALVAAVYFDGGFRAAREAIVHLYQQELSGG